MDVRNEGATADQLIAQTVNRLGMQRLPDPRIRDRCRLNDLGNQGPACRIKGGPEDLGNQGRGPPNPKTNGGKLQKPAASNAADRREYPQSTNTAAQKRAGGMAQPSTTYAAAVSDIRVAIMPQGYPDQALNEEQADLIRAVFRQALRATKRGEPGPRGFLLASCADQFTKDWAVRVLAEKEPWPGAKLIITDEKDVPKPVRTLVWIPGPAMEPEEILSSLDIQNPGLHTETWTVVDKKLDPKGQQLIILMSQKSWRALEGLQCRYVIQTNIDKIVLGQGLEQCAARPKTPMEVELMNEFIKKTIIHAYEESCPLKQMRARQETLWWNPELSSLRRETRKLFNQARRTGRWEEYKIHRREFVYAIRKSDRIGRDIVFHKPYRVIIPKEGEEDRSHTPVQQNGTIWYTDGSKTEQSTGEGATNRDPGCEISINLGNYATVFQAEITPISGCAQEMTRRSYTNKRIQIISDSQAALKALGAVEIHSQAILDLDPYNNDPKVMKTECVGHVEKCVGTRLLNAKKINKGLGGRGPGKLFIKINSVVENSHLLVTCPPEVAALEQGSTAAILVKNEKAGKSP
ncbi:hypothetical protein NQ318_015476 [Aromia moschata]|uniref:DUF4780 domain-containing protein n=1 Tax=Aromia moschata TaxID=1265417 RepID=A0AAV8XGS7_9CUCU|nr:hypothetical protein NQ318_015476 [Aromia moschata]